MKQRLSNLDVSILTKNYSSSLVGSRVTNIYDGNDTKTYIIKFKTNTGKSYLLMESSSRIHLIDNYTSTRMIPTTFCSKFRKHIKNKRLEKISQIGNDRIIDMQFGMGDFCYHIILELFSTGNIILTDKDYKILNTLRRYIYDDNNKILVSQKYPMEMASKYNLEKLQHVEITNWFYSKVIQEQVNNKHNILKYLTMSDSPLSNIPQIILSHGLKCLNLNPNSKIGLNWNKFSSINFELLVNQIIKILEEIKDVHSGYIIQNDCSEYIDFTPYLFKQYEDKNHIYFDSYSDVISKYYQKLKPIENFKLIKHDKKEIKLDKQDRKNFNINKQILDLSEKLDINLIKADLLINNLQIIDNNINQINNLLIFKVHKNDIKKELGLNSVDLKNKSFIMSIDNIDINIYYDRNVHKNICLYHNLKKHCQQKKNKAMAILEISKKTNIHKIEKKKPEKINLNDRKKYWFEDYHWFYSSDRYIIVSGRSAEQNESLVKKHLEKNDIYVHADYHGSTSCVIKNHIPEKEIPISTLEQAGNFVICWSKSWTSVIPDRAYWVYPEQVSKTAPSGEYLSTGSMMIRGKKNYLSMAKMELGIGLLFQIKDNLPLEGNYRFVNNLKKNDIIISCIPVCGPYKIFIKYNYKIKIVPGTQRRGLIFKNIISTFKNMNFITNEENFIYSLSPDDFDSIVPSKIKKI